MEQSCICLIPDAAPNDTDHSLPFPFTALLSDFCPSAQITSQAASPASVFPFRLSHMATSRITCSAERFKESQGIISTGEKRDLAVALWTDGVQDFLAHKRSSKLQDGVETSTTVQSKGSWTALNEGRGQTRGKWGLKPRAEMILRGEHTLWTPLLKDLKASYCLSKMSSGHMPESGPKITEQLWFLLHKSCWKHTIKKKWVKVGKIRKNKNGWTNKYFQNS